MSQTLPELVQVALAGRYKISLWGVVPYPRRVSRMPKYGVDPERVNPTGCDSLIRVLKRRKPVGPPVQKHSLMDVERHLREIAKTETRECAQGLILIARQADGYIKSWNYSLKNYSPEMRAASFAFRDIWRIVNGRMAASCSECDGAVKKRLALNGFVT